jgi:hypothetical protein
VVAGPDVPSLADDDVVADDAGGEDAFGWLSTLPSRVGGRKLHLEVRTVAGAQHQRRRSCDTATRLVRA